MKFTRTDKTINGELEGSIGDSSILYTMKLDNVQQLNLDMSKVTSINSIGVKHWIMWTLRIPKQCKVTILNCPYVIASQASVVMGFTTPNMTIESFRAPFACNSCGNEEIHLLKRGKEYDYALGSGAPKLQLPSGMICVKCKKGRLEPDFMVDKTFKFLE
jgi:hypothetical protein